MDQAMNRGGTETNIESSRASGCSHTYEGSGQLLGLQCLFVILVRESV